MSPETVMLAAIALPILGAALIALSHRHPNQRETVTLVTAVLLFGHVVWLAPDAMQATGHTVVLVALLPGAPLAFTLEPLGFVFAALASGLWIATSVYSIGYMRAHREQHQTRFYACFALALASAMGVAFAGNLVTLFVFYEALTLTTYPLVTHRGTPEARRAGRLYLGLLLSTSIGLQLVAIVWTWQLAGTLEFTPGGLLAGRATDAVAGALLVLYVLGVGKAALMPLHRWLPAAMVAPTPVSALLHAVAVVKAGVFTILKISVYVFGADLLGALASGRWLAYLAAATIVIASLVAMRQDNLKLRLAYSTVSQLSYVILGALLANAWGVIGGGMHIVMHAFGKITLFFCAGAIMVATHKTEVSEMRGLGRSMPITMVAFLIGSLSVIGLPPFGGVWSKWLLVTGALEAQQMVLVGALLFSTLLNVAYLLPIPIRAFLSAPDAGEPAGLNEAPWPCLAALVATAIGCLALFVLADPLYRTLARIVP